MIRLQFILIADDPAIASTAAETSLFDTYSI